MHIPTLAVASVLALGCGAASPVGTTTDAESTEDEPVRLLDDEEATRTETQAMQAHVRARELQSRCDADGDADACHQAEELFRIAADTWRALVEGRPDDRSHPERRFMLAQASLHAGAFEGAASAALAYLETGDTERRAQAATTLVAARSAALGGEMVAVREDPPEPDGQPPAVEPLEIPEEVQWLFEARARYVQIVPADEDPEDKTRGYALDNALLLHRYGHWQEARPALRAAFEAGCSGEGAWEGGQAAWRALRDEALALERYDAVQSLGEELGSRECDFGQSEPPACGGESEHPACLAAIDRVSGQLHRGGRFMQRAEHSRGDERRRWAGRAGEAFLEALDGDLDRIARVTALVQAERAFRLAGNAERAKEVDAHIIRDVDAQGLDDADRSFATVTIASALSRQLEAATAANQQEEVVRLARRLIEDEFALPELSEERRHARQMLPRALSQLGRHAEASRALTELAEATTDPAPRRDAELRAALELSAPGPCRPSTRPLRAFVARHRADADAHDDVIVALWHLAQCQRGRQRTAALEEIASAAGAGRSLRSETRGFVAAATFELVEADADAFARTAIRLPRVETVEDIATSLSERLERPADEAREMVAEYQQVVAVGDARWAASAQYEKGRVLLALEQIVREASWQLPNDLTRQRRELNATAYAQLRGIVEARIAQILAAQAAPIHCRAGAFFDRAVRTAERQNVDSERVRAAREQLRTGEWRCSFRR